MSNFKIYSSTEHKYDPDINPAPKKFALSRKEKSEITESLLEICADIFRRKMVSCGSTDSHEDLKQSGRFFFLRMLEVFNKFETGLIDENCNPIPGKKDINYYFLHYFRERAHLVGTNSITKRRRRKEDQNADFQSGSHEGVALDEIESHMPGNYGTSDTELKSELNNFLRSLPRDLGELFRDTYIDELSKSALRLKYGKEIRLLQPRLARKLKELKRRLEE